jgi:hypothetical protein
MAEKVETILRRNIFNTRPRDFYDIFILSTTQSYNKLLLKEAVLATALHRGTTDQIADVSTLLQIITDSAELRQMWEKYCREFDYAKDVTYEQVIKTLKELCALLL